MKILLVIDQFYDANNGMTISARRFAKVLADHGHEIRIVSTGRSRDPLLYADSYSVPKQYIPFFDKLVAQQGMTFAKPDDDILEQAIAWADLVHFLVPFMLSRHGIMIAKELGVPYTAAFHCQPENVTASIYLDKFKSINKLLYLWFNHYFYQYCDHIHCPSQFIADELRKTGYQSQLHVISNGIDPDFVGMRKIAKPPELQDKFIILSIGRFSREKRQDLLIKAVKINRHAGQIQIILAGQGPKRDQLEKLGTSLPNPPIIKFYSKPELLDVIAMSDLYVHAASAEIEAMSCMEAFAGGLVPVIAGSEKSATPQFALDERSLFAAGSPEDLSNKIDYWYNHPEERKKMSKKYAFLGEKYNLETCVFKAEEMFYQAVREAAHEIIPIKEASGK
ncbi:MAG TPA: glycosyltransferase [Oscillospiraceae bacterium]|nr:glycosyltransferase [Oscillospiraceae bacterium]HPK36291.1 glycosyltransferase [Oscillospiraceae bacterium]HPR75023.1 glycosyltransferase [Oscillospiraceae bacterium]